MRVLYIGDLNPHTRSFQRYRAMLDLGHEVVGLSTVPIPTQAGVGEKPGLYFRIRSKLGYPLDPTETNPRSIEIAEHYHFDLVWVEKGLMIRPSTLKKIRTATPEAVIVCYSEDDMYARHNQSAYFRRCLPIYDIVFTTKSYNVQELPQFGARRVVFVDKAYDRFVHRPLTITEEDKRRLGADVIFIGTFEENRANQMLYLAQNGIRIRVWGGRWEKWKRSFPNMIVEFRAIYGEDYTRALCASKIALCFLRKANRDLQTDRTMEIPACGTFMLAERTREHLRLFEEGKEAEFFDSKEELLKKVRYYLQHDEERERIAKAGRRQCIESGYSHHDRLKYMLDVIRGDG